MDFKLSDFPLIPFGLALALSLHGLRKRSLSPSGAFGALTIAGTMMAVQLRGFGVSCIVMYLLGTRATKVGKKLKGQLEAGHDEEGYRNVWQILCNTFSGFVASILWSALYIPGSFWSTVFPDDIVSRGSALNLDQQCPISTAVPYSRYLVYAAVGHFGCCLGDTLASELGILSRTRPILITTLKSVPPGTNGGLSVVGLAVSFLGGAIIGLGFAITLFIQSIACRRDYLGVALELVAFGFVGGGIGSLIDSLLGATLQQTRYSKKSKKILLDDTVAGPEDEVAVISGLRLFTNGQVNLISSTITAVIIGSLSSRIG